MMPALVFRSVAMAAVVLLVGNLASAQVVRTMQVLGQRRYVSPWSGSLRWLSIDQVKKELELIPEQEEALAKIRRQMQQEMAGLYKKLRDLPPEKRQQRYAELNAELAETVEQQIQDVLLPHQVHRLKQISLQLQLRASGAASQVLTGGELAKQLNITDEQKGKIREAQREAQQELQQKMREFYAKAYEEARQKVLQVLTKQQRDKLEALMGEKFELQPRMAPAVRKKR